MSCPEVVSFQDDVFKVLVKQNVEGSGVRVSLEVQNYLSNLLEFYILTDHLFSEVNSSGKREISTLANMYFKAYRASVDWQYKLKKLGDTSLYMSGFFGESLKRKSVSSNYYVTMGQKAYQTLAVGKNRELFEELADRFLDLVFILCRIWQQSRSHASYILSLLDQYMETNHDQIAKELLRHGVNISLKNKGSVSH